MILKDLHPIFSGFPPTLVTTLIIVEIAAATSVRSCVTSKDLFMVRSVLVGGMVVGSVAAFISGYAASSFIIELRPETEALVSSHHSYGKLLLGNALLFGTSFVLAAVARNGKGWFQGLYFMLLLMQLILTGVVGSKGGSLVFDHGVGVATQAQSVQ